jgi:DNA polymerase-3 subunit delta
LPETTRLVFVEHEGERNRLPAKHPVVRLARQHERGYLRKFDSPARDNLRHWVEERARKYGGTIERRAADQLAIAVGGNLRLLDQEIAKLVTYTNAERQITSADVDALVPYVQEGKIFDFVDALGQRDARAATQVLHSLMDPRGTNVPWIFGMIVRQFRLLIQVKELEDSGSSLQAVIKTLKLHPFPARKLHLQAIHFTGPQLEAIYRHLLDTDLAIKTSKLTPALAMDLLVADLAATEL